MEIDKLVNNFIHINDNFMKIDKRLMKQAKKIRGMRFTIVGLSIACLYLASELAERKRCENYLQKEIDDLKEEVHGVEIDEDGGAADA